MKSLDRAMIVSDTLKTETSPVFISLVRVPVPVPFPAPLPVPDSGFSIRPEIGNGFFSVFPFRDCRKRNKTNIQLS